MYNVRITKYIKIGLVPGFLKNQILVACPTCRSGGQLSPDRKRRGLSPDKRCRGNYSGKI